MKPSDQDTPTLSRPRTVWLTPSELGRASRFRACATSDLLPSEVIPAPSPRGTRWGQGPLVESPSLQLGAAPRQQRHRQPR